MSVQYRAPEEQQRVRKEYTFKDTRGTIEYFRDEAPKWDVSIVIIIIFCATPFYNPIIAWLSIPLSITIALWSGGAYPNRSLPMKLPCSLSSQIDYNDPKPGQANKFNKASGTILLGNLRKGRTEVWIAGKDLLTHMLLIGTTGAGKTETLISLSACTAFCMGGGIIYVDAKAAPKLLFQFATLARIFGREDDLRIINYITGNRSLKERYWERLSNTTNPFARGTAGTCSQTLVGLMPAGGAENKVFSDKAIAVLNVLMPALVELRDMGVINITPSLIGESIGLAKMMELAKNHIEFSGVHYQNISLSERTVKSIGTFLKALPGFNSNLPPEKQPEEVARQFGFAEGYFTRVLANLAGTFGHIYETELADADFVDIVMNNRILVVLVPAMEQASEERAALGKVVLSSIRTAMAQGLGGKAEGNREDVIDSLPIDLRIPTIIIVDEYAEVAVDGFAVTATQGRGLGMSVVFAGQDLAGFVRASEQEADMIFGNTRLKILMALEDPEITWRKFKELAGTMKVAEGAGWEQDVDGMDTYKTNISAGIRDADRIDFQDLKEQREGEGHVFERANIHRVQIFHHGIDDKKLVSNFRINRMLKVKSPDPDTLELLQDKVAKNIELERILASGESPEIGNIPTLDKLSVVNGFTEDDRWPWRLLETVSANDPNIPISTASDVKSIVQNENQDLSHAIESLNKAQENTIKPEEDNVEPLFANEPPKEKEDVRKTGAAKSNYDFAGMEGMDMDDLMGEETIEETPVNEAKDDFSERINTSLCKAENHWIFKSNTDEDGLTKARRIYGSMVEINSLAGVPERESQSVALDAIEGVTAAVMYPSDDIESKPEDVNDLWDALHSLED